MAPDQVHGAGGASCSRARLMSGGFYRGNSARERIWKTKSGKAEFTGSM